MRNVRNVIWIAAVLVVGVFIGSYLVDSGTSVTPAASAAGGKVDSPTGVAPDRYVYYPGTEELDNDEIRITACGTGMPGARRGQAATCFLVELGDGQKFLFDIGTGAMRNVQALMIPANFLTKVAPAHRPLGRPRHALGRGMDGRADRSARGLGAQRRAGGHGDQVRRRALPQGVQLGLHDARRDDQSDPRRDHGS
jgi:hypothetical protein